jgi:PP-loop superfamily ATP-utilizing enzyme
MGLAAFNRMRRLKEEEEAKKDIKEDQQSENTELKELRARGKELGVKNWHNMGEEKLQKKIEEVEEYDKKLGAAIDKAVELDVEGYEELDLDNLLTAIEAKENELQEELLQLRIRAIELDIEDAENKDAETLTTEIAVKVTDEGGEGNGDNTD